MRIRQILWPLSVAVVALFHASTTLAQPATGQLTAVYHQDFRSGGYDFRGLKVEGPPGATDEVRAEPEGLRITTPAEVDKPVSVSTRFRIRGDFEITARFEAPRGTLPKGDSGVGPEIYIRPGGEWGNYASMVRSLRPDGKSVISVGRGANVEGKREHNGRWIPTQARAGAFRLVRTGTTLRYYLAEGDSADFRQVFQSEVWPGDVERVRLAAIKGNSSTPVSVLWKDLSIRAEALPGWVGEQPTETGPPTWVLAAGFAGLVLLGGIVVWSLRRGRTARAGHTERAAAAGSPETGGRGGFTLIEVLVVIAIIGLLAALLVPAVQYAREASRRMQCQSNLRQFGLALHNYQAAAGVFPFGVGADGDGSVAQLASSKNRRYSLHAQILPYLEQSALFHQLNFSVPPFDPDTTGDPSVVTGRGPNETAAQVRLAVFLCPSDFDRMPSRPWGQNNYRSCNGSTWSGRAGNGMFGQSTRIRPADVSDGLSMTAAICERIRGHDDFENLDVDADLFRLAGPWTEESFRSWCEQLSDTEAATLERNRAVSNSGMTWLEGNMTWTRYNHVMPPGRKTCVNGLTWNGVAMTANSRHPGGVNLLMGDGSVRFIRSTIDASTWRALGTIAGGEVLAADQF